MAPSSLATVNASVKTPDTSTSGDARTGYELTWDLFDKTTGTWLSSGTSTPALAAPAVTAAQARLAASTIGLTLRGRRTGEPADFVEAMEILRQALDLMPAAAAARPKALSALAMIWSIAARRVTAVDELGESRAALLDSAVELERAAVASAGAGHRDARKWRANVAAMLFTRHQVTGDRNDCVEAVSILRTVLDSPGEEVPERGRWLINFAHGLSNLGETTGADYAEMLAAYRAAADAAAAPADTRVDAARPGVRDAR